MREYEDKLTFLCYGNETPSVEGDTYKVPPKVVSEIRKKSAKTGASLLEALEIPTEKKKAREKYKKKKKELENLEKQIAKEEKTEEALTR